MKATEPMLNDPILAELSLPLLSSARNECPDRECTMPHYKGAEALTRVRMIGVNHRDADLASRAAVSIPEHAAPEFLHRLRMVGAKEAFVLSTCNRTEIYFTSTCFEAVEKVWAEFCGLKVAELRAFKLDSMCSICHLFRVAAGLDSAVLGETEILAQIKNAWQIGRHNRSIGKKMEAALQHALRVSKRVRTETGLCKGVTSVASLAIKELLRKTRGLEGKTVLVIGAGQTGVRVAKELVGFAHTKKIIVNRTLERAEHLANTYEGFEVGPWSKLDDHVREADVIISAVTTNRPVLTVSRINELNGGKEVSLIDLGVPANIEADLEAENVWRLNIDVLANICAANSAERQYAVPEALKIIQQELEAMRAESLQREAAPIIQALVQRAEDVRSNNLDWAMERLEELSPKQQRVVQDLSIRIVRGMLEVPIQQLKESSDAPEFREAISRLFGVSILA